MSRRHSPSHPSPDDSPVESGADANGDDHRKKRRNRMTQSCLNCHNSKRKCDRKRPWCQRCVLLGLTGLCIYEVDDLAESDNTQNDENARLKKRVADLECLVRQMKGKPEPRWLDFPAREGVDPQEVWHSRAGKRRAPTPNSEPHSAYKSTKISSFDVKKERSTDDILLSTSQQRYSDSPPMPYSHSPTDESDLASSSSQQINYHTPMTYAIPGTSVPPHNLQVSSSFSTLSGGLGEQATLYSQSLPWPKPSVATSHCLCRNIPTINNTYHSLNHHLQSALYNLRQCSSHSHDSQCVLYRKIDELHRLVHGGENIYSWAHDSLSSPGTFAESEIMTPLSASSAHSYTHMQAAAPNGSPDAGTTESSRRDWQHTSAQGGAYQNYLPEMHDRYLDYGGKGDIS